MKIFDKHYSFYPHIGENETPHNYSMVMFTTTYVFFGIPIYWQRKKITKRAFQRWLAARRK